MDVDVGEGSGLKPDVDDGGVPSAKVKVVGEEASTDGVDEVGAPATVDTANLGTTIADEINVLKGIFKGTAPTEELIGSLHIINVTHTKAKVLAHEMILRMAASDEKPEKRVALYKGRKYFDNRHITRLKKQSVHRRDWIKFVTIWFTIVGGCSYHHHPTTQPYN